MAKATVRRTMVFVKVLKALEKHLYSPHYIEPGLGGCEGGEP